MNAGYTSVTDYMGIYACIILVIHMFLSSVGILTLWTLTGGSPRRGGQPVALSHKNATGPSNCAKGDVEKIREGVEKSKT